MDPKLEAMKFATRRHFLRNCSTGMGALAMASLADRNLLAGSVGSPAAAAPNPLAVKPPHFAPKAKSIIYLFMAGAPPHLDLFDYKPKLKELDGQPCPDSFIKNERFAFITGHPKLLASPHKFAQHGQSGATVSEILPHIASVSDNIAFIKSMTTEQFNHAPGQLFINSGSARLGRPSMGSWMTYGLGSESQNLPGFVVFLSGAKRPDGGASMWGNAFLPSIYQGVQFRSQGDPVLYVSNPNGMDPADRRRSLDALKDLNKMQLAEFGDPETITRIEQYEMAYRMQTSVPELMDISSEPASIHKAYGTEPGKISFANNCLLARRLVERGTRFVQLFHWGWDMHGTNASEDLMTGLPNLCRNVDQAAAALVQDLKNRGMLDETLVIWGGEFGRTPMNENRFGNQKLLGRDHHRHAFTLWMAGGGIKPGITYGSTDDIGYFVQENPVDVHDFAATILHCMGLDHEKLTYKFQGRDFRLTDVSGKVVKEILA